MIAPLKVQNTLENLIVCLSYWKINFEILEVRHPIQRFGGLVVEKTIQGFGNSIPRLFWH